MNVERANRIRADLGLPPVDQVAAITPDPLPVAPKKPRSRFQPGDVFGFVIHKITGQLTANCGKCGAHKDQMNAWGWIGCLKPVNFKVIKGWIVGEAKARGHEITDRQVAGLLKAAFKELRKKK